IDLSRPHVRAAAENRRPGGLADAVWNRGCDDPVAAHRALRAVAVGNRAAADLAGAADRGIPRVDAGADVDALRLAGAAGDRHRAVVGHAGCRRAAGDSLPGP